MKRKGGVKAFYEMSKRKAKTLYDVINQYPEFYVSRIDPDSRSLMNVMFYLQDEKLTPMFLEEALQAGFANLRGHRVSGGVRASMYNAMPEEAATKLAEFMVDFAKRNS